jgi:hypothetical protein
MTMLVASSEKGRDCVPFAKTLRAGGMTRDILLRKIAKGARFARAIIMSWYVDPATGRISGLS